MWPAGLIGSRLWSPHFASGGRRCTRSFASPECLWILCGAILARKAAGLVVFDEALPCDFVSQPLPSYAQETQHPGSFLRGPWRVIC